MGFQNPAKLSYNKDMKIIFFVSRALVKSGVKVDRNFSVKSRQNKFSLKHISKSLKLLVNISSVTL